MRSRFPSLLAVALASACQSQRYLHITSEPSGALVRLDGDLVGATPCEIPFGHYGTRRVTLYLEGYSTYSRELVISPPWYGWFPLDIVTEVLFPWGWDDVRKIHAKLNPGQSALLEPDFPAVLERAENLRRAGPDGPQPLKQASSQP